MSYTRTAVACPMLSGSRPGYVTKGLATNMAAELGLTLDNVTVENENQYQAYYNIPGYSNYQIRFDNYSGQRHMYMELMGKATGSTSEIRLVQLDAYMADYSVTYWEVLRSGSLCSIGTVYGGASSLIFLGTLTSKLDNSQVKMCGGNTGSLVFCSDSFPAYTSDGDFSIPDQALSGIQRNSMTVGECIAVESFFLTNNNNQVDVKGPYVLDGHGAYYMNTGAMAELLRGRVYTDGAHNFLSLGASLAFQV